MILSAALDLGTTRIKGTMLDDSGNLTKITAVAAPPVTGSGLIRESSPSEYVKRTEDIFHQLYRNIPDSTPLGISSQRSSFLLWDKETSEPVTPLISWMDRRALGWVEKNTGQKDIFTENTGLPFSPHYAGPKLASLFEEHSSLKKRAERGLILFGTIECYLIWLWTRGDVHVTDITMASRTLMFDLKNGDWSSKKLSLYNIPENILPKILTSCNIKIPLKRGPAINAIPADQPAAFYASAFLNPETPVVNLGTGGFIMSLCDEKTDYIKKGLLYTPLYSGKKSALSYGLEGTVNGITASIKKTGGTSANVSKPFPPGTFCIPDSNGVGSPYWRPSSQLAFSGACSFLGRADRRRVLFEGIIFRVSENLEALNLDFDEITLCGGLSRNPFFKKALATCLHKRVLLLSTPEGSLLGAALMSAGKYMPDKRSVSATYPSKNKTLKNKYFRWKEWVKKVMDAKTGMI